MYSFDYYHYLVYVYRKLHRKQMLYNCSLNFKAFPKSWRNITYTVMFLAALNLQPSTCVAFYKRVIKLFRETSVFALCVCVNLNVLWFTVHYQYQNSISEMVLRYYKLNNVCNWFRSSTILGYRWYIPCIQVFMIHILLSVTLKHFLEIVQCFCFIFCRRFWWNMSLIWSWCL